MLPLSDLRLMRAGKGRKKTMKKVSGGESGISGVTGASGGGVTVALSSASMADDRHFPGSCRIFPPDSSDDSLAGSRRFSRRWSDLRHLFRRFRACLKLSPGDVTPFRFCRIPSRSQCTVPAYLSLLPPEPDQDSMAVRVRSPPCRPLRRLSMDSRHCLDDSTPASPDSLVQPMKSLLILPDTAQRPVGTAA